MQIIIQTQYQENYGAHSWDGVGECPQYWKNKGGDFYIVDGVSFDQYAEFPAIVEKAVSFFKCSYSDNYSAESVIDWSVREDGESTWEEWETPKRIQFSEL